MSNLNARAADAWSWIRDGYRQVRREPLRWLGMALMYLLFALLLRWLIPVSVLYVPVLALLSPIMLGGALMAARAPAAGAPETLALLTTGALRQLFQVFRDETHSFAIVLVSIVTLALAVLVSILEMLLPGGTIFSGVTNTGIAGPMSLTVLFGIVLATLLYLALTMTLLYIVPLTLFGQRLAIPAAVESFQTCWRHPLAVAVFVAPFMLVDVLIVALIGIWPAAGYLLFPLAGVVLLPVFVAGLNLSYGALFEAPAITEPAATP